MLKWFMGKADKRNGNKPESVGDVRLDIILADGALLPCDIEYMDREGGSLSFPEGSHPELSRRVRFKFLIDNRSKELVTDAVILESDTVKGKRLCQFRFSDMIDLETALGPGAFSRFNRRRAFRVVPGAHDKIKVALTWGETGSSGRLTDISVTGMGIGITVDGITVDLAPEVGGALGPLDRLALSFQLPGCDTRLRMMGIVRNRNLRSKNICYGIDFEWDPSDESQRQAETVRSYVMQQQRSMLERSAWIRRG